MAMGECRENIDTLLDVHCPICLTVYKDPRALACCHTFCLDCLTELIFQTKEKVISKKGIECSICRAVTKINKPRIAVEEWAKELPLNYALVAVLQSITEKSEKILGPLCKPCRVNGDTILATVFCQNCKEHQCASCASAHRKFGFMKNHVYVNLSDSTDHGQNTDFSYLVQCQEHGKRIKFFCNTHKTLCCSTCVIIVHKQCDNVEVKHVQQAEDFSGLRADFSELKDNFKASFTIINKNGESTYSDIAKVEERLANVRERVLKRLNEFERRIRYELEMSKWSIKLNSEEKKSASNRLKAALQGSIQILDSVKKNGSTEAIVIVVEKLKKQNEVYQTALKECVTGLKNTDITLDICHELETLLESTCKFGHLESRSEHAKLTRKVECLKSKYTTDLEKKGNKEEPCIRGLDFLPDGRIIVIDYKNKECLIMNESLQLISSQTLPYIPHNVTVLSTNEILISSGRVMKMYKVTVDNALESVGEIKVDGIGIVNSVCETNNKDELVACLYFTNDPIRMITRGGNTISSLGDFPDMPFGPLFINCAFSKVNDSIVVSLCNQNEIRIIDYDTKATVVIINDYIKSPKGLATDESLFGSFFVCSRDTNSIVQMTFNGIPLSVHKLDIMGPDSVAISGDNKQLAVSNLREGRKKLAKFQVVYV